MLKRTALAKIYGFKYVMCDILTVGWAGLQSLRDETQKQKLAIHAHRAFHAAFDRNPKHGMSMLAIAKLSRLIGVDNIHIGTVIGKLVGEKDNILTIEHEMVQQAEPHFKSKRHVLKQNWHGLKDVIPVSSGGLHPGITPYIIKNLGKDIVLQAGGGIHGHPNGSKEGAAALRQSIDATLKKIPLKIYSKKHKELEVALKKWGAEKPV